MATDFKKILRQPPRLMLTVLACLVIISLAAENCVPESTWPKLIGYGLSDTRIISASRCSISGHLVLAFESKEDNFVKNVPSAKNLAITTLKINPTTEEYGWFKVMENVRLKNDNLSPYILYTPDCSKILISF